MSSLPSAPSSFSRRAEGLLSLDHSSAGPLAVALREIVADFPGRFTDGPEGWPVRFRHLDGESESYRIESTAGQIIIHSTSIPCALRALATVMSDVSESRPATVSAALFPSRGAMVDASRNAVPRPETLQHLIRRLALMGFNRLLLYCEDTITIHGEPFLGYFRGAYSPAELRELDRYAEIFGMEVVPCIQTLGHMEQALQWPAYWPLRDTPRVLLADEPATYAFIEKLIDAATAPFRSRRIHIGMDEAHGVGSGAYRQRNGPQRPFDVLSAHLDKVAAICRQRGLAPMIWSDMFFRLGSRKNHYYDRETVFPPGLAQRIPLGVDLVYWDYYHRRESFYDEWIARHQELGQTPVFASAVWTWNRFWAELPHSIATMTPGLAAARRAGIQEVFATLWGDDGMECDLLSALPGLEAFAALCFEGGTESVAEHFRGTCDADWKSWHSASDLDRPTHGPPREGEAENLAKLLLWHDPLLGFLEKHLHRGLSPLYARSRDFLEAAAGQPGHNHRLAHPARLARCLALKAQLHETLRPAYHRQDRTALAAIFHELLPALQVALRHLHESHRALWEELYRPFGWDVLDRRYGGLRARLESLADRLRQHLDTGSPIEELAAEPLTIAPPETWADCIVTHARAASASAIA